MALHEMRIDSFKVSVTTAGSAVRFKTADYLCKGVRVWPNSGAAYILSGTAQASALTASTFTNLGKLPSAGVEWHLDYNAEQTFNLRKVWLNGSAKSNIRVQALREG